MRAWVAHHRLLLVAVALLTLAGGALRVQAARNPSRYQSVDERAYARLARNLVRFHRYDAPEMADPVRWPPGAPFMFALAREIRPLNTNGRWDVPSAYPMQAAFGTLQIPALLALGWLLAGPAAGLVAAAGIAFYPPLIDASGDLLTEPLGALMLIVSLIAVVLALRRPRPAIAAGAGLLLGLAVLVRADLLGVPFLLVGLLAVVAWRSAGRRTALVGAGAMLAGVLVALAPWSAYASSVAGKFVPVSSGGASNLYVGTYLPGGGTMFGLKREWAGATRRAHPELRGDPYYRLPQKAVIETIAATEPGRGQEAALRAKALHNLRVYVLGDPLGFAGLAAKKVWRLWGSYTVGTYGSQRAWIRAYHLLLVAIGFAGLLAALVTRRRFGRGALRGAGPGLLAIAAVLAYVTAVNVVLVAEARHNLPIVPVLLCAGAAGFAVALRGRRPAQAEAGPSGAGARRLDEQPDETTTRRPGGAGAAR